MIEGFRFSSDARPEATAFPDYVALYSHGADVTRGRGRFAAEIEAWRLDGVLLFDRRVTGVVHSRRERSRTDGFDHMVLHLVLGGRVIGSPESGFEHALAGEIYVADTCRSSSTEFVEAHVVTASVDRGLIEAGLGTSGGLHGKILRPPHNGILADFLVSLTRRANGLAASALPPLSRAFVDILASVDGFGSRASSDSRRQAFVRRELVERHIANHLGDRSLSVETISSGTGISRSTLYRLFDRPGGIARLIQRRRLDTLRTALDAKGQWGGGNEPVDETLADLVVRLGFSGEGQARRVFQEAFGLSPKEYLTAQAALDPVGTKASHRRWIGWMTEVS